MADAPGLYKGADLQELSTAPLNSLLYLFELRSSVYSFANAKLRSTTSRVAFEISAPESMTSRQRKGCCDAPALLCRSSSSIDSPCYHSHTAIL